MSRHRNIRNYAYEEDMFEDVYGHSVEEHDLCVSPTTAQQFLYHRGDSGNTNLSSFLEEPIEQEEGSGNDEEYPGTEQDYKIPKLDRECQAKLNSCMDQFRSILGDSFDDMHAQNAIIKHNYDLERAIDDVLNTKSRNNCFNDVPSPSLKSKKEKDLFSKIRIINKNYISTGEAPQTADSAVRSSPLGALLGVNKGQTGMKRSLGDTPGKNGMVQLGCSGREKMSSEPRDKGVSNDVMSSPLSSLLRGDKVVRETSGGIQGKNGVIRRGFSDKISLNEPREKGVSNDVMSSPLASLLRDSRGDEGVDETSGGIQGKNGVIRRGFSDKISPNEPREKGVSNDVMSLPLASLLRDSRGDEGVDETSGGIQGKNGIIRLGFSDKISPNEPRGKGIDVMSSPFASLLRDSRGDGISGGTQGKNGIVQLGCSKVSPSESPHKIVVSNDVMTSSLASLLMDSRGDARAEGTSGGIRGKNGIVRLVFFDKDEPRGKDLSNDVMTSSLASLLRDSRDDKSVGRISGGIQGKNGIVHLGSSGTKLSLNRPSEKRASDDIMSTPLTSVLMDNRGDNRVAEKRRDISSTTMGRDDITPSTRSFTSPLRNLIADTDVLEGRLKDIQGKQGVRKLGLARDSEQPRTLDTLFAGKHEIRRTLGDITDGLGISKLSLEAERESSNKDVMSVSLSSLVSKTVQDKRDNTGHSRDSFTPGRDYDSLISGIDQPGIDLSALFKRNLSPPAPPPGFDTRKNIHAPANDERIVQQSAAPANSQRLCDISPEPACDRHRLSADVDEKALLGEATMFACTVLVKYRTPRTKRLCMIQQRIESDYRGSQRHVITPFDFSTPSPDEIVLRKQAKAFRR